jgi:hypothetical protein
VLARAIILPKQSVAENLQQFAVHS